MLPVKTTLLPTVSRFFEDDWNNLFDWSNLSSKTSQSTLPFVNVQENSDSFLLELAAPGMQKNDFEITIQNHQLVIQGNSKQEKVKEGISFTRREFNFDRFTRSFNLNQEVVDTSKMDASYEDGILKILIPKQEKAKEKPIRQIQIK